MELWSTLGYSETLEGGLGDREGNSTDIFHKNMGTGTNLEEGNTSQQVPVV